MMPTPMKSGTSASGFPSSKWEMNSLLGSISSVFQTPVGPPDSRMTVSCTTNRLWRWSHTWPFFLTELHTSLIKHLLSPPSHDTEPTAEETLMPQAHSTPLRGKTTASHFQRSLRG